MKVFEIPVDSYEKYQWTLSLRSLACAAAMLALLPPVVESVYDLKKFPWQGARLRG